VIEKLLNFRCFGGSFRKALIIGRAKDSIDQAHTTVIEWGEDLESDPRNDLWMWRTAVALAQLEKLEPVIGQGRATSYKTLASALNLAGNLTSFGLNIDELQRILSLLARRWLGEDHEPASGSIFRRMPGGMASRTFQCTLLAACTEMQTENFTRRFRR